MAKLQYTLLVWLSTWGTFLLCLSLRVQTSCDSGPTRIRKELDISRLTTLEVEDYVRRQKKMRNGKAAIVISVGATEQHGPTGLIGTDQLTAAAVASQVCNDCDVLLGPHLSVGMSLHHCQFAGSTSLRPSTFVNMICDIVWSFQQSSNITHFFFVNGHGGNVLPMKLAFAILRNTAQNTEDNVVPWLIDSKNNVENNANTDDRGSGEPNIFKQHRRNPQEKHKYEFVSWYANEDNQKLAKKLYGDKIGQHATPDEISLTHYLFPEARKDSSLLNSRNVNRHTSGRTLRRLEGDNGGDETFNTLKLLLSSVHDERERDKLMELGKFALSYMDPFDFKDRFRDGRMNSDPSLSSYEHGEELFSTSTKAVARSLREFMET